MAYSTRDLLAAMITDAHLTLEALREMDGAAANWMMQFQADLLRAVERPDNIETTALSRRIGGTCTGHLAYDGRFPCWSKSAFRTSYQRRRAERPWRAGSARCTPRRMGAVP
jgi:glycerol kinase